jgi:hypothetical protein
MKGGGVKDYAKTDQEYVERLANLIDSIQIDYPGKWGKHFILGFDKVHIQLD